MTAAMSGGGISSEGIGNSPMLFTATDHLSQIALTSASSEISSDT